MFQRKQNHGRNHRGLIALITTWFVHFRRNSGGSRFATVRRVEIRDYQLGNLGVKIPATTYCRQTNHASLTRAGFLCLSGASKARSAACVALHDTRGLSPNVRTFNELSVKTSGPRPGWTSSLQFVKYLRTIVPIGPATIPAKDKQVALLWTAVTS